MTAPPAGPAGSNWAHSHSYAASGLRLPGSVAELQELVGRGAPVRALGTRHSFSDIADSPGVLVGLERLPADVRLDESAGTVSFSAGLRYGDLAAVLHRQGWALANLASLPHIGVAGAVATGTHGSGDANGTLSAAVAALELVDGRGELVRLDRSSPDFAGAVVSLGALGILTRLTLDVQPGFQVRQDVSEGLAWADLLDHLDTVMGSAYSVSVFTDWRGTVQVWQKSRLGVDPAPEPLYGARPCTTQRHMIAGMPAAFTTAQLGVPGPWHERLPHFRMEFTPSSGEELQSEYLLPRARAREALEAVAGLGGEIAPLLHIGELRTVAADRLWLSGASDTPALGIHFTWRPEPDRVLPVLARVEERLLPLGGRPHWGKLFRAGRPDLAGAWPRLPAFLGLAERYDPDRLFGNDWLARTIGR